MSRIVLGILVIVVAGLSGCASPARVVRQDPTSVVVAIPDNTNVWPFYYQDEAKQLAGGYVHDPVLVTSQRVKVGEQTTSTSDTTHRESSGRSFGDVISSSAITSVTDRYEYHLEFRSVTPVRGVSTGSNPPPPGGPAASLSPQNPITRTDGTKPLVIPPGSPATNMPSANLTGPGH
jgi:hypothetical protein